MFKPSADALIEVDGKQVKWGDYQKSFIPATKQTQALLAIAQAIDAQKKAGRGGQPGDGDGRQKKPSILDGLKDRMVVGGEDIAALVEELRNDTINPMSRALALVLNELKGMRGRVGSLHEGHAAQEFRGKITGAIKALDLPSLENGAAIPGAEILEDIFENTYLAYDADPNNPEKLAELDREYPEMVKKQFNGLRNFFREYEKVQLAAAELRKRKAIFARPGGGASGTGGQQSQKPLTNKDAAARLFRGEGVNA